MIYYLLHISDKNLSHVEFLKTVSCKEANQGDQFPGVYFSLVTKENIDKEDYFPGKYAYLFSKKLLKQKNYHINLSDINGMLNEHYSYFPWNLDQVDEKLKKINRYDWIRNMYNGNEVVFHDPVPMTYCSKIIKLSPDVPVANQLPHKVLTTSTPPNLSLLPFYAFVNEDTYSGDPKPPASSLEWYQTLAKVANIQKTFSTKKGYINAIRKKSVHLCQHREEQKLEFLKNYEKPTFLKKLWRLFFSNAK